MPFIPLLFTKHIKVQSESLHIEHRQLLQSTVSSVTNQLSQPIRVFLTIIDIRLNFIEFIFSYIIRWKCIITQINMCIQTAIFRTHKPLKSKKVLMLQCGRDLFAKNFPTRLDLFSSHQVGNKFLQIRLLCFFRLPIKNWPVIEPILNNYHFFVFILLCIILCLPFYCPYQNIILARGKFGVVNVFVIYGFTFFIVQMNKNLVFFVAIESNPSLYSCFHCRMIIVARSLTITTIPVHLIAPFAHAKNEPPPSCKILYWNRWY